MDLVGLSLTLLTRQVYFLQLTPILRAKVGVTTKAQVKVEVKAQVKFIVKVEAKVRIRISVLY